MKDLFMVVKAGFQLFTVFVIIVGTASLLAFVVVKLAVKFGVLMTIGFVAFCIGLFFIVLDGSKK